MTSALILLNKNICIDQVAIKNNWNSMSSVYELTEHENYLLIDNEIDIPLLCRALLVSANLPKNTPVILTTTDSPVPNNISLFPSCNLHNEDSGWLYFPSIEIFQRCAMNAIRDHDPSQKDVTLKDCWNQAVLAGLTEH